MNTEPKDQTKRRHAIALLEATIAKHAAAIEVSELGLKRQIEKQIHRLAELRCQKLLLQWQAGKVRHSENSGILSTPQSHA